MLLMDVDGPLFPFNRLNAPEGWDTFTINGHPMRALADRTGMWLNPEHGEALRGLAEAGFDLVWATGWGDSANRVISPLLGLPNDLPVVSLKGAALRPLNWKIHSIVKFVGRRQFVWFDDEICPADIKHMDKSCTQRHMLVGVDDSEGLTPEHFQKMREWLEG